MKKTLLITLLLIPVFSFSQITKIPVDGFSGIKFGSSKEEVKTAILAMGGVFHPEFKHANAQNFSNVKFGDRVANMVFIRFLNNKAYEAMLIFSPTDLKTGIDDYNNMVEYITGIYGAPKTLNLYKAPYKDGDGPAMTLVRAGFLEYNSFWLEDNSTHPNGVSTTIDTDLNITVEFQDGILKQIAEKSKH